MADRHRTRRPEPIKATTAAARFLEASTADAPHREHWHDEAWRFRASIGELRFAELWLANSMSRGRLVAARRPSIPGGQPEPLPESHPAQEIVAGIAGGAGGQSALLRAFATHLLTPGIGYLVGIPQGGGVVEWGVYSARQIRLSAAAEGGGTTYELIEGEHPKDIRVLPPGTLPVKVYRPDPLESWRPDSPVRGALPILRELALLTQHVEATATSRLAGAGILFMDSNIVLPAGWEDWIDEFVSAVTRPIKDRGSAAAYAPFPVRIPVPKDRRIQDLIHHMMFNTPFDEHALRLREEGVGRLATAMDMPKHALTGEQENHWGKWATTEEGITLHVEPNLELVTDGLTKGILHPALRLMQGRRSRELVTRQDRQRVQIQRDMTPEGDDAEIIVWYDTSDLRARPDRSTDTQAAYDRWEATGEDLRREAGITDAQPADPNDEATQRRVWLSLIEHPTLGELALMKLGLADEDELPSAKAPPPPALLPAPEAGEDEPGEVGESDEDETDGGDGPPATRDDPEPSEDEERAPPRKAADVVPAIALVAACDGIVYRALEKAGNRLRQAMRRRLNGARDCPAVEMHTCCNATSERPMQDLLEGAWGRVPLVAAQLGEDPEALLAALDGYTQTLIRTRTPHSWDRLAVALGCGPEMDCIEAGEVLTA